MLKIVYLITLSTFGVSTLVIDGFRDISESVPKKNIDIAPVPSFLYSFPHVHREQQVEVCAETCREFRFRCNSFVVLETQFGIECTIVSTLGSIFKPSQDSLNDVVAVYERESLPTARELAQRFSNSPSDQQYIIEEYGLPEELGKVTQTILRTCSIALEKNLPVARTLPEWLRTKNRGGSQLQHQSEFRKPLSRALESWKAWPSNPQAPLQSPDLLILTFLDIFFRSLVKGIITIYDPNEKILVVEGYTRHLLIRSLGPNGYILIFGQSIPLGEGNVITSLSPLLPVWAAYGPKSSEFDLDHETWEMFEGAMENYGNKVLPFLPVRLHPSIFLGDNHALSLQVVLDAATIMLNNYHDHAIGPSYEILFQDLVTAVVSSVVENEMKAQRFQSNLLGATGRFIPDMRDIDIITG